MSKNYVQLSFETGQGLRLKFKTLKPLIDLYFSNLHTAKNEQFVAIFLRTELHNFVLPTLLTVNNNNVQLSYTRLGFDSTVIINVDNVNHVGSRTLFSPVLHQAQSFLDLV